METYFLEIENKYRLLHDLSELDEKKIARPLIFITDWQDLLVLNNLYDKKFDNWIESIYFLEDIDDVKLTYDVIFEIIKSNFIDRIKSNEDVYYFISKNNKSHSDYIYRLIISKYLNHSVSDEFSIIKEDTFFINMTVELKEEVEFAANYLIQQVHGLG